MKFMRPKINGPLTNLPYLKRLDLMLSYACEYVIGSGEYSGISSKHYTLRVHGNKRDKMERNRNDQIILHPVSLLNIK